MYANVESAAELLRRSGVQVTLIRLLRIAPLPFERIFDLASGCGNLIVVEDTASGCGIREALSAAVQDSCITLRVTGLDLGNGFVTHGSVDELHRNCGVDPASIAGHVMEVLKVEN
jgi:1-deoxy-D-xylulose-5-phosphate synthase